MLNVWVNYPKNSEALVRDVGDTFDDYIDYSVIETDIGRRIVKETSNVVEVINHASLKTKWGGFISPDKLSGGCKVLLLMLCEDARNELIFNNTACGGNCDKFLEEIVRTYDVNLFLGRFYIPLKDGFHAEGVKFMKSGLIVHSTDDFIDEFYRIDDRKDVTVEDVGHGEDFDAEQFWKGVFGDRAEMEV